MMVGALLFSMLMLGCAQNNTPEEVARDFIVACYKGDAQKMIASLYIPEEEKQKAGIEDMISGKMKAAAEEMKERADQKGGVKTVKVTETSIDDENKRANVTVHTEFNNNETKTEIVKLIYADGKWKISL